VSIGDRPITNSVAFEEGALIAAGKSAGAAGLVAAYAGVPGSAIAVVRATGYWEPTVAAQLEVVSSSVNDTAAGTGARTLRITYYDGSCQGPYTTDVVLNGTAAVPTGVTNIRFVESMILLTVGNNGTNVGTLTLRNLGGGSTIGMLAASEGRTFWGHHYVAAGRIGQITALIAGMTLSRGSAFLRGVDVLTANAFEAQITAQYRLAAAGTTNSYPFYPSLVFPFSNLYVPGPARVTAYVNPDTAVANNVAHVSFGYLDV
jgi:hypothetical protein